MRKELSTILREKAHESNCQPDVSLLLLQAAEEIDTCHSRDNAYIACYTRLQFIVKDINRLQNELPLLVK